MKLRSVFMSTALAALISTAGLGSTALAVPTTGLIKPQASPTAVHKVHRRWRRRYYRRRYYWRHGRRYHRRRWYRRRHYRRRYYPYYYGHAYYGRRYYRYYPYYRRRYRRPRFGIYIHF